VDGMTRSKDIATFCQETPSGLRWENSFWNIMKPLKSLATQRLDGNLAASLSFTANGCAPNWKLSTTLIWSMKVALNAWIISMNSYQSSETFTSTAMKVLQLLIW
jgi:hypothetical protein